MCESERERDGRSEQVLCADKIILPKIFIFPNLLVIQLSPFNIAFYGREKERNIFPKLISEADITCSEQATSKSGTEKPSNKESLSLFKYILKLNL